MQISEITFDGPTPIDGYGPGFFRVAGKVHDGAILLSARGLVAWGGLDDSAAILELAALIDVVLVGTGAEMQFLPRQFRATLEAAGIGVEVMQAPSACRTYNILLAEGRRVAAALISI